MSPFGTNRTSSDVRCLVAIGAKQTWPEWGDSAADGTLPKLSDPGLTSLRRAVFRGSTPEQFRTAYPRAAEFFRLKRHYDPDELLQNQFYRRFGLETSGDVGTQAN